MPENVQIRTKDIEAFDVLAVFKNLTVKQYVRLTGRDESSTRWRFNQLSNGAGYLHRIVMAVHSYPEELGVAEPNNADKNLYSLGRKGYAIAKLRVLDDSEPFSETDSPGHAIHEKIISDVHINIHESLKNAGWEIDFWKQGRAKHLRIGGKVRGKPVSIIPDAFFRISDHDGNALYYFLEVTKAKPGKDKALRENAVIAKAETYLAYVSDFREKYGADFRVLFTMPTETKLQNMLQMFKDKEAQGLNNKRFYFALNDSQDAWQTPKDDKRYALIPTSQNQ